MNRFSLIISFFLPLCSTAKVIDDYDYQKVVTSSRTEVAKVIQQLNQSEKLSQNKDQAVLMAVEPFLDRPYAFVGADGEGDWCRGHDTYQPGCLHIKQHPMYRTDKMDCQTFVQNVMAILPAQSLDDFEKNLVKMKYGDAKHISFQKRNHFISGDWLPSNQQSGFIMDAMTDPALMPYVKTTQAVINRKDWFAKQMQFSQVINDKNQQLVTKYKLTEIQPEDGVLAQQTINLAYIPKETLLNDKVLNKIPTPAMVSVVRDSQQWKVGNKPIKELTGTDLLVSHTGLLARHTFNKGEIIYQEITCEKKNNDKVCLVTPKTCAKSTCQELMLINATSAYPNDYYWYQDNNGAFHCSKNKPDAIKEATTCNRVMAMPLKAYLQQVQYGQQTILANPSILGLNIQRLVS